MSSQKPDAKIEKNKTQGKTETFGQWRIQLVVRLCGCVCGLERERNFLSMEEKYPEDPWVYFSKDELVQDKEEEKKRNKINYKIFRTQKEITPLTIRDEDQRQFVKFVTSLGIDLPLILGGSKIIQNTFLSQNRNGRVFVNQWQGKKVRRERVFTANRSEKEKPITLCQAIVIYTWSIVVDFIQQDGIFPMFGVLDWENHQRDSVCVFLRDKIRASNAQSRDKDRIPLSFPHLDDYRVAKSTLEQYLPFPFVVSGDPSSLVVFVSVVDIDTFDDDSDVEKSIKLWDRWTKNLVQRFKFQIVSAISMVFEWRAREKMKFLCHNIPVPQFCDIPPKIFDYLYGIPYQITSNGPHGEPVVWKENEVFLDLMSSFFDGREPKDVCLVQLLLLWIHNIVSNGQVPRPLHLIPPQMDERYETGTYRQDTVTDPLLLAFYDIPSTLPARWMAGYKFREQMEERKNFQAGRQDKEEGSGSGEWIDVPKTGKHH